MDDWSRRPVRGFKRAFRRSRVSTPIARETRINRMKSRDADIGANRRDRQEDFESCSFAGLALQLDAALVAFHDTSCDGQSQSDARSLNPGMTNTAERFKHQRDIFSTDSNTFVGN